MAIVAKTNIQVEDLLREKPTSVTYPHEPAEEPPVNNPTQTMERERLTRYHQAITKWKNECNVINHVGVLCGDKPWDMADRKVKSLIYLSLGVEGRKMHGRKFPHTNVETKTTKRIWEELEITFIRPRNVTFDRYLLLTRRQQRGETMEQFHSALRSLAEHCQLGHLEDELLRDIFTANMIDPEIQKELLKVTLSPERALEVAIGIELGARNQLTILSKNAFTPMDKQETWWPYPAHDSEEQEDPHEQTLPRWQDKQATTVEIVANRGQWIIDPNAKQWVKHVDDAINRIILQGYAYPI